MRCTIMLLTSSHATIHTDMYASDLRKDERKENAVSCSGTEGINEDSVRVSDHRY